MTTTPGPGRDRGPAPASSGVPGPTPAQLRRWAAESELLARHDTAASSHRVRLAVWAGFVLVCLAVIIVCVVAVVGFGGSFEPGATPTAPVGSVAPR